MSKRKTEDLYRMEDDEYRDRMRKDLQHARQNQSKKSSVTGSVVISVILVLAGAVVVMHTLGMISFEK